MDRVPGFYRNSICIGVGEAEEFVDIFVFGIHEFAKQAFLPPVRQPHVCGGERIVFRQIINQLPLFDFFHQFHALGHREECSYLRKHMFACLQALDGIVCVGWAECGEQHRIEILLQELIRIRCGECSGVGMEEFVAHVLVVVAARDNIDVEELAGLIETHSPSKTPDSKTNSFFGVEYSDFINLFHVIFI